MLDELRKKIDAIDTQVAELLSQRMFLVDEIGNVKKQEGSLIRDHSREESVVARIRGCIGHPLLKENIDHIYDKVFEESRSEQALLRYTEFPYTSIGIIGLGLIGGSICKALKVKDNSTVIATVGPKDPDTRDWIDVCYATIEELVEHVELIIIATPISTVMDIAKEIQKYGNKEKRLLVLDVSSVKQKNTAGFSELSTEAVQFVSTHPMAGKEKSGFLESESILFVGRPWVILPHERNNRDAVQKIEAIVRFLGAVPVFLDPVVHDKKAALISHIPMLLAKWYRDFVVQMDEESLELAGPGFLSFTRLAQESDAFREEIYTSNKEYIEYYLMRWVENMNHMRDRNANDTTF